MSKKIDVFNDTIALDVMKFEDLGLTEIQKCIDQKYAPKKCFSCFNLLNVENIVFNNIITVNTEKLYEQNWVKVVIAAIPQQLILN